MRSSDTTVVHLVTHHTRSARLELLETLLRRPVLAAEQVVLHLGPGPIRLARAANVTRVHAVLPHPRFGSQALRAALSRRGLLSARRPIILHAWSQAAASWCLPLATTVSPLVLDITAGEELRDPANWSAATCLSLVCSTASARRRLLAHGVPAPRCVVIPPAVDQLVADPTRRGEIRARLGLSERETVLLALPPVARQAGTLMAVWAGLVVQQARPEVRLVIPPGGRELERVRWFVQTCQHDSAVRFASAEITLGELLAAADLAVYVPRGAAPTDGVAAAIVGGCPLLASTAESADGLLVDGRTAWLARPVGPEDAARALLRALAHPEQSRQYAERARAWAGNRFSPATVLDLYRRAYANLAARRPIGAGERAWTASGREGP